MARTDVQLGTDESVAPRSDFPVLEEVTYLNQAAIGLVPTPALDAVRRFEGGVVGRGTVGFDDETENRVFEGVREAAARLIHAHPDQVAALTSATEALNQLAWFFRPAAGTNVVSIDIEFPSVTYPWLRVAQETGCEVRLVAAEEDPDRCSVAGLAEVVDERTDVICVSHVQYATGHRIDIPGLVDLARANDAVLIVDATQSAGVVPLDVAEGPDVVLASGYKWLCAPFGAAFCYFRSELLERFTPTFVGWRSTVNPPEFDARRIEFAREARRVEISTVAYGAGIGLGAAANYLADLGIERIFDHVQVLSEELAAGLRRLGGVVLTPDDRPSRAGIVMARFPGHDAGTLARALAEERVIVSPRLGGIRMAVHAYSTRADVARALEALERTLAGGPKG